MIMTMKATAKAHTNIALIKYWGKRDESLILPTNNSLSLTLDGFCTTTTVHFQEDLQEDVFFLDGEKVVDRQYVRVTNFLNQVRHLAGKQHLYATIDSYNHVPTAAGFASSASGFAALAGAASQALYLNLTDQELSRLTRLGSGSACRSIYGGFTEWQQGQEEDGSDSFAVQIVPEDYWDLRVGAVVLSESKKDISSRQGMKRTAETSPFFNSWVDSIPKDLEIIKEGIHARDFEKVGEVAEANCLKMHATTSGAHPPFTYFHHTTFLVMETVQALRHHGIPVYFTIDAGPNVKVLYLPEYERTVKQQLLELPGVQDVILSRAGQGITYQ